MNHMRNHENISKFMVVKPYFCYERQQDHFQPHRYCSNRSCQICYKWSNLCQMQIDQTMGFVWIQLIRQHVGPWKAGLSQRPTMPSRGLRSTTCRGKGRTAICIKTISFWKYLSRDAGSFIPNSFQESFREINLEIQNDLMIYLTGSLSYEDDPFIGHLVSFGVRFIWKRHQHSSLKLLCHVCPGRTSLQSSVPNVS